MYLAVGDEVEPCEGQSRTFTLILSYVGRQAGSVHDMTDEMTRTRDASLFDSQVGAEIECARQEIPRLRLLYHVDLGRVGAVSHPDAAFEAGQWLSVGRIEPLFSTPSPQDVWRPISDPMISRTQLRVRWLPEVACFEVEPAPSAKRKLHIPRLSAGAEAPGDELLGMVRLPAGSCIAIEDRVLLGLEVMSLARSIDENRLGLIGESDEMWRLRQEILEVGRFRKPVLVLGETGTGKELVASAIHQAGRSSGGAFVPVNCAALPEQLVESQLFGHTRGAFTGADTNREGLFRAADGGTLFLDELCEMPIGIQPKLLRTLQDGQVTAVGQSKSVKADVRLIAATNRAPEAEIAAGRLRADLYHRLAAHVVRVAPLRARRLDIPEMFVHFLDRQRHDHPELERLWRHGQRWRATIPLSFFVELMRAAWDGNVRELENVTEQTARRNLHEGPFQAPALAKVQPSASVPAPIALSTPPPIPEKTRSALSVPASSNRPPPASPAQLGEASQLLGIARKTLAKLIDDETLSMLFRPTEDAGDSAAERLRHLRARAAESLHAVLLSHEFNQARVAKALGVSAWTLIRLMQDLGIPRPSELSAAEIRAALDAAGGDVAMAASRLKVSEHGLKKRLGEPDREGE